MKKTRVMEQIFYGDKSPCERPMIGTSDRRGQWTELEVKIKKLKAMLPEENQSLVEDIMSDRAVMENDAICSGFQMGFQMGARLMLEIMEDSSDD